MLPAVSSFIGKDGVRAKSQIRIFTNLTGTNRQEKQTRHFYSPRRSVLIKNLSKLDI